MTGLEWPEVDEPYDSLEANALHKARTVVGHTGVAALADDTGLEVAALGGAPGVFTADGFEVTAEGVLEGRIARTRRGAHGFGYDPVFEVERFGFQTLAEIPEGEKNRISHRARALQALARLL